MGWQVNPIKVLLVHEQFSLFQLTDIFCAFAIIREVLKPEMKHIALIPHAMLLVNEYFRKFLMAHAGCSTTTEAEKTSVILARIMNETPEESEVKCLKNLLSQFRTRNLNIKSAFFNVNWNIILSVSVITSVQPSISLLNLITVYIDHRYLFGHHMSIWNSIGSPRLNFRCTNYWWK